MEADANKQEMSAEKKSGESIKGNTKRQQQCITRVQIQNFKNLESVDLRTSWLTVLVGANSAGKSSTLQSIVMLSQSAAGAEPGYVDLNREALQLGTLTEVIRRSSGASARPKTVKTSVDIKLSFGSPNDETEDGYLHYGLRPEKGQLGEMNSSIRFQIGTYNSVFLESSAIWGISI